MKAVSVRWNILLAMCENFFAVKTVHVKIETRTSLFYRLLLKSWLAFVQPSS